jgi:type VI protein secretion system component VasK
MAKWYILTVLMTALVLALCVWVTNKAYSRKWENDEPEEDPFDFDAAAKQRAVQERNGNG